MKKKALILILNSILITAMISGTVIPAYCENNKTDVEKTEGLEESGDPSTKGVKTGSQETLRDRTTDVDEDIKEEIKAGIDSDWEEITISTPEDLQRLANSCLLDTWSANKHVVLANDISLGGYEFSGIPTFGGTFDGNGHCISDMDIMGNMSHCGFFRYLQTDAIVKDLTVTGRVDPAGDAAFTGGIVGNNRGVIINCKFIGAVKGNDYTGGIAGINELDGIICDSSAEGFIKGTHFTGGIAGENMGNISRCVNKALVNTSNEDVQLGLEDINIENYISIFNTSGTRTEAQEAPSNNEISDSGGIAGLSIGIIISCRNEGDIGYSHVGYNVGGIAGRQSGYIYDSENTGHILGRKDVGGIAGQAEPYVTVDLGRDIAYQLTENIGKLNDMIDVTLNDAGNESDVISGRLSVIQQFTGNALDDTRFLADSTVTYANNVTGAVNEAFSRVDYILEEASKKDGVMDQVTYSAGNTKSSISKFRDAVEDLNIYDYLSDSEKAEYDGYKQSIKDATEEYDGYINEVSKAYLNYHMWDKAKGAGYGTSNDLAYLLDDGSGTYTYNVSAITLPSAQGAYANTTGETPPNTTAAFATEFGRSGRWVHHREDTVNGTFEDVSFPDSEDPQKEHDNNLSKDAAEAAAGDAKTYASAKYTTNHPLHTYANDMSDAASGIAKLVEKHLPEMSEDLRKDAEGALDKLKEAAGNLESASSQSKDIVRTIADKPAIQFPQLDGEYRAHTTNLSNNLQAMNDNFGLLNNEMNNASDVLVNDLKDVNAQFNKIMMLYTDAIDGVLDMDMSNTIEDESLSVAETCTDATIEHCTNKGRIEGDLDVAGIAGTMAVEYDYDLEGDITGIKDANMNTTFISKCVLRDNRNEEKVSSVKSYVGGVCGLQELGTILNCSCYGDVSSDSGDHAGGITGSSLSYIVRSFVKARIEGKNYVGGIAGEGTHISDCISMVRIPGDGSRHGSVAGSITSEGKVRNNRFVSDELAGIDGISYAMKAEPITYRQLIGLPDTPDEFNRMKIEFILDDEDLDEEDKELGCVYVRYMDPLTHDVYPEVANEDGKYVKWSTESINKVTSDEVITAQHVRYITTLAGDPEPDEVTSRILVDGHFKEGDKLDATKLMDYDSLLNSDFKKAMSVADLDTLEEWSVIIPDDGDDTHILRYRNTGIFKNYDIHAVSKDGDTVLKQVGEYGMYRLYEVTGSNLKLKVVGKKVRVKIGLIIAAVVAGIILLIVLLFVISRTVYRKRGGIKRAAKGITKAANKAVQNLGNQNQLFYHGDDEEKK